MIDELDQILKNILNDSNAPGELRTAEINFEIPKEKYAPTKKTINLFLYDIHENRDCLNVCIRSGKVQGPIPIEVCR